LMWYARLIWVQSRRSLRARKRSSNDRSPK
jgi:hypothetical protein